MQEQWVRDIKDQCVAAGVPFFYKQHAVKGKKISLPILDGPQWLAMPEVCNG
jgi:protein gp37